MNKHAGTARCPDWCTSDHSVQHHPEDRLHTGDGLSAPLIQQLGRHRRDAWTWYDDAIGFTLAFEMPVDTADTHIALATDDGHWEARITIESAQRLVRTLDTLLVEHAATTPSCGRRCDQGGDARDAADLSHDIARRSA